MAHYIDAEKLKALLEARIEAGLDRYGGNLKQLLESIDSLQQDEKAVELEMCSQTYWEERGWMMIPPDVTLKGIESLLEQVRKKLKPEQPQVADASKMEPGVDLEKEIKRYTEEKYNETFGNGQGTLDEFDWEDIAVTIEETAVHFVGWKEKAPEYKTISKILALGFMDYLDDNRQEGKMCLSNAECEDITKAVSEQDWKKLERYAEKYARHFAERGAEHLRDSKKMIPEGLEKAARHVYESWMGGTMDDVRRDMVELGTALNARKED